MGQYWSWILLVLLCTLGLGVTGATRLFTAQVPKKIIQQRTGHRSLEALRKYEHTSQQQDCAVSSILSSSHPIKYSDTLPVTALEEGVVASPPYEQPPEIQPATFTCTTIEEVIDPVKQPITSDAPLQPKKSETISLLLIIAAIAQLILFLNDYGTDHSATISDTGIGQKVNDIHSYCSENNGTVSPFDVYIVLQNNLYIQYIYILSLQYKL